MITQVRQDVLIRAHYHFDDEGYVRYIPDHTGYYRHRDDLPDGSPQIVEYHPQIRMCRLPNGILKSLFQLMIASSGDHAIIPCPGTGNLHRNIAVTMAGSDFIKHNHVYQDPVNENQRIHGANLRQVGTGSNMGLAGKYRVPDCAERPDDTGMAHRLAGHPRHDMCSEQSGRRTGRWTLCRQPAAH